MAHRANSHSNMVYRANSHNADCYTLTLTLGSSKPNMSRMPIKPSVACFTALFNTLMDLDALDPAVPTVEAC